MLAIHRLSAGRSRQNPLTAQNAETYAESSGGMLFFPGLPPVATAVFEMDQRTDYPFKDVAVGAMNGACSGLTFLWIKNHRFGKLETFKTDIKLPDGVNEISGIYQAGRTLVDKAWNTFYATAKLKVQKATGLTQAEDTYIFSTECADRLATLPEALIWSVLRTAVRGVTQSPSLEYTH